MKSCFDLLEDKFIIPEKTRAKCSFGDIPDKISFDKSNIVVYGVPLDITTSFGKGTNRGPEAIRLTSANLIENFIFDENKDVFHNAKIYDLGDIKIPNSDKRKKNKSTDSDFSFSDLGVSITEATLALYSDMKLPILLGGEHTISYYSIKTLAQENPIIIHFDAHRDMKPQYQGKAMSHATPFYHLLNDSFIQGNNLIQIGIRQSDLCENKTAEENKVITFDAWNIHRRIDDVLEYLTKRTKDKKIYITFDIDVYDIAYVPCTGTPEPFGLNPFEIVQIIKSISKSAKLIGLDLVEVGLKNNDYREAALATHTLLRILCRDYAIPK